MLNRLQVSSPRCPENNQERHVQLTINRIPNFSGFSMSAFPDVRSSPPPVLSRFWASMGERSQRLGPSTSFRTNAMCVKGESHSWISCRSIYRTGSAVYEPAIVPVLLANCSRGRRQHWTSSPSQQDVTLTKKTAYHNASTARTTSVWRSMHSRSIPIRDTIFSPRISKSSQSQKISSCVI
ncbi:hypothetical protein K458DRAFT_60373 [Lentithecium fluviatile CBS 122367]|uniref:Uncharacterized protein n=1 Tax=Lentithecium fluviatile CBS 122367 TaxID=1168545 RepID=A0A6G1IX28_9PLEO|nr:hypothetical protein K458DRAFT_60373 [Lentithecium fluviatile CBS 122367]